MKRLEREVLLADRASVSRMLERMPPEDVLGRSSFGARLRDIENELAKVDARLETAGSVALMFGGAPVDGSRAIDSEFARKILESYHSLLSKNLAIEEVGALGERGPVPVRTEVNLAITEILRGSVGFLLEERTRNADITDTAVKLAIDGVTQLILNTAGQSDSQFESAVEELDPRVLVSLRAFFRTLDESMATLRIVEHETDGALDAAAVHRGRVRTDTIEVEDTDSEAVVGEVLGLLPDSRQFEMRISATGEVIKGTVVAAYIERYLALIDGPHERIVGRKWRTKMRIREIKERNKPPRRLYRLIGLIEQVDSPVKPRAKKARSRRKAK